MRGMISMQNTAEANRLIHSFSEWFLVLTLFLLVTAARRRATDIPDLSHERWWSLATVQHIPTAATYIQHVTVEWHKQWIGTYCKQQRVLQQRTKLTNVQKVSESGQRGLVKYSWMEALGPAYCGSVDCKSCRIKKMHYW